MHRHAGKIRKFKREKAPRELMFRNMATSLILHEKIKTTLEKAKEVRPITEKLITAAKKGDVNAIRKLSSYLLDKNAVQKLVQEIAPLYKERKGGYTRIIKIGKRAGDAADMAYIELLDIEKLAKPVKLAKSEKKEAPEKATKKPDKENKKEVKAKK